MEDATDFAGRKRGRNDDAENSVTRTVGRAHTTPSATLKPVTTTIRVAALPDNSQMRTPKSSPAFLFEPNPDAALNSAHPVRVMLTLPNLNAALRKRAQYEALSDDEKRAKRRFGATPLSYYKDYPLTVENSKRTVKGFGVFANEPVDTEIRELDMAFKGQGLQTIVPNLWGDVIDGQKISFRLGYVDLSSRKLRTAFGEAIAADIREPVLQVLPYLPVADHSLHGRGTDPVNHLDFAGADPSFPGVVRHIEQRRTAMDPRLGIPTDEPDPTRGPKKVDVRLLGVGEEIPFGIVREVHGEIPSLDERRRASLEFPALIRLQSRSHLDVVLTAW